MITDCIQHLMREHLISMHNLFQHAIVQITQIHSLPPVQILHRGTILCYHCSPNFVHPIWCHWSLCPCLPKIYLAILLLLTEATSSLSCQDTVSGSPNPSIKLLSKLGQHSQHYLQDWEAIFKSIFLSYSLKARAPVLHSLLQTSVLQSLRMEAVAEAARRVPLDCWLSHAQSSTHEP